MKIQREFQKTVNLMSRRSETMKSDAALRAKQRSHGHARGLLDARGAGH